MSALARHGLPIMVEPLPYHVSENGRAQLLDDDDKLLRAVAVAAGLGTTSTSTWLKVPAGRDVARMLGVTTLPALILGGAPGPDPEATYASWEQAMDVPNVRGLVVGRALLYPPDGDVAAAIDPRAARIVRPMNGRRHRPDGTLARRGGPVALTPEQAGWARSGLRVLRLADGRDADDRDGRRRGGDPAAVDHRAHRRRRRRALRARRPHERVRPGDRLPVRRPRQHGDAARERRRRCRASPTARCERRLPPRYGPAEDVPIEVRGAGVCTRQVTNFLSPESWPHADRLMAVELLTPGRQLVVVPAAQARRLAGVPGEQRGDLLLPHRAAPTASALHRLYTSDGKIDDTVTVRDGDVFLIPRGYHGPCIAAPGHTMYYLNVLAGPDGERSMAFCDDPAHHWVRESWADMATDPRCPMNAMPERRSIGIGVIGFGWMGQAHSRSYRRIPTLFPERTFEPRLVACADNVPARCDEATSSFGFEEAGDDWRRVIEHPDVDVVVVTAPNMLHEQLCVATAEAGKHLFCEKPVGGTPEQTARIGAATRRAGIITGVGYNYRFVPLVMHARDADRVRAAGRDHQLPRAASSRCTATTRWVCCRGASSRTRADTACRATSSATPSTWPTCWSARSPRSSGRGRRSSASAHCRAPEGRTTRVAAPAIRPEP